MALSNRRALKEAGAQALSDAPQSKKIISAYAGITFALTLVVTLANFWLNDQISTTGGLSNFGNRSLLETVQAVLSIAQLVLSLCLGAGLQYCMLRISRRQSTELRDLTQGLHIWGPLVRASLFQAALFAALGMAAMYAGFTLFLATPLADPLMELLAPVVEQVLSDPTLTATQLEIPEGIQLPLLQAMVPGLVIILLLYAVLVIPVAYRYRMVNYLLLDTPRMGALRAMSVSRQLLRRKRWQLCKLDLSFWWYYGLVLVGQVVLYGDWILALAGISLPIGSTGSYFLFLGLYMLVMFAVYYFFLDRVEVAYANAYEAVRPKPEPPAQSGGVVLGNIFQM